MFTIRTASLSEIVETNALIPEFNLGGTAYFEERLAGKTALNLVCCDGDNIAGYGVSYLQDDAVYIWVVGTLSEYRRRGVYQQIFDHTLEWARNHGAVKIRLKTRNDKRDMLAWLVKHEFLFTGVETQPVMLENRIMVEKVL